MTAEGSGGKHDFMIYLSLCIPTNGISEWVFPVLAGIYKQKAVTSQYEVIVTNNGDSDEFHLKMLKYEKEHDNLIYKKTEAYLFENQIEALKLANGIYLKFLNHRSMLENDALEWMIELVKSNLDSKPVMYLSNGSLNFKERKRYDSFDGFVRGLKHMASWTTGVGIWKSDFEKIPDDFVYNKISPHSEVLFAERKKELYIIDDRIWSQDIDESHKNKGKYDLYKAFCVEEIAITLGLYIDGDISSDTLKAVLKSYKKFVAYCYLDFNILHKPCSYDINGFEDAMGIFMNSRKIKMMAFLRLPYVTVNGLLMKLKKKFFEGK